MICLGEAFPSVCQNVEIESLCAPSTTIMLLMFEQTVPAASLLYYDK